MLYLRELTHAVVLSLTSVSRTVLHYNIGMNRHRYYDPPLFSYTFRTTFKVESDYNILIISQDAQTCMARYVPRHLKPRLCLETLAIAWSRYFSKVEIPTMKPAVGNLNPSTKFIPEMKQNFNQGGRPHKINPSVYRYVVRFDAAENTVFLSLFDKSGAVNKAAFIKNVLLGKPFKVFVVDENTRIFIDKLSALNSDYRTLVVDYDTLVRTLRENFTEKKAMSTLYRLEQITVELVKTNREIVALAREFDARWSQKSL